MDDRPYPESTLTKLQIFELYVKSWLPVFLAKETSRFRELHIFDFFAGSGTDSNGVFGSPLRILQQLRAYEDLPGWGTRGVHCHFFDKIAWKIKKLDVNVKQNDLEIPGVTLDIRRILFTSAFKESRPVLANKNAAKLVFIDQYGVGQVTDDVFENLIRYPTCDFLFFISSSTLNRFRGHRAIQQRIPPLADYYHVHRAVYEHFRSLCHDANYFLSPFSLKNGPNIYGIIFGSGHPLGMDKFLQIVWKKDAIAGEANFDIDRENIDPGAPTLFREMSQANKVNAFEQDLELRLRNGQMSNELDVIRLCFEHGVTRQHAKPVLMKLKEEHIIDLMFRVPDIDRLRAPRPIRMCTNH